MVTRYKTIRITENNYYKLKELNSNSMDDAITSLLTGETPIKVYVPTGRKSTLPLKPSELSTVVDERILWWFNQVQTPKALKTALRAVLEEIEQERHL